MKIVARDTRGIVVRLEAGELQSMGVEIQTSRGSGYYQDLPDEAVEAKLTAAISLYPDVLELSRGADYNAQRLDDAARILRRMRTRAEEILGRIKKPAEEQPK